MAPSNLKGKKAHEDHPASKPSKRQKDELSKSAEDPSNAKRGLLTLPVELQEEVLNNLTTMDLLTKRNGGLTLLPSKYLERTVVIRSLSQACVIYRRVFLPLLKDLLFTACCKPIANGELTSDPSYTFARETLVRKCQGLLRNPELASLVGTSHLILPALEIDRVAPKFASTLAQLPNLHTLHILHVQFVHTSSLVRESFEKVTLPQIRTLVIPAACSYILKQCPRVKTIECFATDWDVGAKLVDAIADHCKEVEEMIGFRPNEKMMKRIVLAVPHLRVFQIRGAFIEHFLPHLASFKMFNTLITDLDSSSSELRDCVMAFRKLPASEDKRHIRLLRETLSSDLCGCVRNYTEVDIYHD